MGDLDSLLQDFSYLKSLEHKNQAPKRVHKKLHLPPPSVKFAIEALFESTGEAVFDRIFHRPIGRRCFTGFLLSDHYLSTHPAAGALIRFLDAFRTLHSEKPVQALQSAEAFRRDHLENPVTARLNLWGADLFRALDERMERLQAKALGHAESAHMTIIKDAFHPFTAAAQEYLSKKPWEEFRSSKHWVRYCQWKHLELNMRVSEEDFDVHRIIGRGGFGEVFPCRKRDTGAVFAMKKLDKKRLKLKHQEASAVYERTVLAEMHSKFVTNLKYAFHDHDTLFLILDLMEGGDLSFHLKRKKTFTEYETKFYAAEILMGIAHIHSRNMIYRDLKPANVLLDGEGHARISDMGLVRDISKTNPTSECGTHGYMAPEVLREGVAYGQGADWWSLGCCIYQFLTGHSPFRRDGEHKNTKEAVQKRTLEMEIKCPPSFSPEAADLVMQLLDRNPKTRLGCRGKGASEIRAHPFFAAIDWQALIDHKLQPVIRPFHGQVNAKDVYDIDRFDAHDTRKVTITPADNSKYYSTFDHIMSHQWQEEVLTSVFDQITELANKVEAKSAKDLRKVASPTEQALFRTHTPLLQGNVKQKGGFMGGYSTRYMCLWEDHFDLRKSQLQPAKHSVLLQEITGLNVIPEKDGSKRIEVDIVDQKTLVLKFEYGSDHIVWYDMLQSTVKAVKSGDVLPRAPSARLSRKSISEETDLP